MADKGNESGKVMHLWRKKPEFSRAELERQAIHDPLTGLYNRRYFQKEMNSLKPDDEFSIIMMDIDFFKQFNDLHGHEAGDAVLKRVAKVLGKRIRTSDTLARYGGEEIVLLMKDVGHASLLAEELRVAVAESHSTHYERSKENKYDHLPITVSVGVATHPKDSSALPGQVLTKADAAMYRSKDEGRNKISIAD